MFSPICSCSCVKVSTRQMAWNLKHFHSSKSSNNISTFYISIIYPTRTSLYSAAHQGAFLNPAGFVQNMIQVFPKNVLTSALCHALPK